MAENKAVEMTPTSEVGSFKRGDYTVHILIQKTKEIACPPSSTVDPLFEIQSLGKKQYSSAKSKIGSLTEVVWSEHVFIEQKDVTKQQAESGKILIKLLDKGLFKNEIIGQFEFDLSYIYLMDKHAMEN